MLHVNLSHAYIIVTHVSGVWIVNAIFSLSWQSARPRDMLKEL